MKRYNLSLNEKYTFIGMTDKGEANYETCDNCGALIRYVVHLKNSKNENLYVGSECVKTLLKADITNEYSMLEQINAFKKVATAENLLKANNKLKIWQSKDFVILVGLNKNNKAIKISVERRYDPFINEWYSFIDTFIDKCRLMAVDGRNWCFAEVFNYYNLLKK